MSNTCKKCGDDKMVSMSSIDNKICPSCKAYQHWPLEAGQKSVLIDGRVGTKVRKV